MLRIVARIDGCSPPDGTTREFSSSPAWRLLVVYIEKEHRACPFFQHEGPELASLSVSNMA